MQRMLHFFGQPIDLIVGDELFIANELSLKYVPIGGYPEQIVLQAIDKFRGLPNDSINCYVRATAQPNPKILHI